jgi:hypothetical protein
MAAIRSGEIAAVHLVGGGVGCEEEGVAVGKVVVMPDDVKKLRIKNVFCMFGILGRKPRKLILICCGITGLLYIGVKFGFAIVCMKKFDIVEEDELGVAVAPCGLMVAANGFDVVCADADMVHIKTKIAPTANTPLRTTHLPRFELWTDPPHEEAGE